MLPIIGITSRKGEDASIVNYYDVLKFIEHGGRCRPAMDYVQGELLIFRLKRCREIEKTLLFEWMRELLRQLEQFHKCFGNRGYRYMNPYSVLVTEEGKLLLLDLEAESNEFVLRNMQKRAMRDHFVKPIVQIRENTKLSLDLYGYAKTIQFILANVQVEPSLTSREENRLEKIIDNCLCKNSKKQYEDFKRIQRELPTARRQQWEIGKKIRKKWLILPAAAALLLALLFLYYTKRMESDNQTQKMAEQVGSFEEMLPGQQKTAGDAISEAEVGMQEPDSMAESEEQEPDSAEESEEQEPEGQQEQLQDGMKGLEENIDALQEYVLKNTSQDNWTIIEQGEDLKRELFRYLAAAYDREELKEKALEAYQELCRTEAQEELLEAAYLRRIALEKEQSKEMALETGKEALERIPESRQLAEKCLDILAELETMTKEKCGKELEVLSGFYPDLKSLENYHRLEEIYELTEGGNQDEEKSAAAGN